MGGTWEDLSEFLESIAVTSGGGVGGYTLEVADGLEGEGVPDLQDDRLALFGGEASEGGEGGGLVGGDGVGGVEPAEGFAFATEAAPEGAAMVEGAVPEGADQVEPGFTGGMGEPEEGAKGVVQDVLGLGMAEAEGAAIEDEFGGRGVVKRLGPMGALGSFRVHFGQ